MQSSEKVTSVFSLLCHWFNYTFSAETQSFERGILITSIDVDVGNHALGKINKGKNDRNVHVSLSENTVGKIEESVIPLLVDLFNTVEVPVTFAIRGQLLEVDESIIPLLLNSPVRHDIGAHGYSHRQFVNLSKEEADWELSLISEGMQRLNVFPKSFVFPRNGIAHLDLLKKHGYACYRGQGTFLHDGMYIVKIGGLYDVHPSLYINGSANQRLLTALIDICIAKKLPFHMWFHPKDFGYDKESAERNILKVLYPMFQYARKKESEGLLDFETMYSVTQRLN